MAMRVLFRTLSYLFNTNKKDRHSCFLFLFAGTVYLIPNITFTGSDGVLPGKDYECSVVMNITMGNAIYPSGKSEPAFITSQEERMFL